MGDVVLLPPTSLSNAVKQGGDVLDSWLNHQTILAIPKQYPPPDDTRLPWNKSYTAGQELNGPSYGRIFMIAKPKPTTPTSVHTRSTAEVTKVSRGALRYNISPHMEQMAAPRKVHPPDVNEPWTLKNRNTYKCPARLVQMAAPRKQYPRNDRPSEEIGRPPRAALTGRPPSAAQRARAAQSFIPSAIDRGATSTSGPTTTTTSSSDPTSSSTTAAATSSSATAAASGSTTVAASSTTAAASSSSAAAAGSSTTAAAASSSSATAAASGSAAVAAAASGGDAAASGVDLDDIFTLEVADDAPAAATSEETPPDDTEDATSPE